MVTSVLNMSGVQGPVQAEQVPAPTPIGADAVYKGVKPCIY